MSHKNFNKSYTPPPTASVASATPEVPLSPITATKRDVEWYRQCPHCWDNLGGVGTCQNTVPPDKDDNFVGRRYYKCDRCGAGFSREFEIATLVVEKRVVNVIRR